MNVRNPSEYTFINLILLKVDDKYPADNSYFLIGFLFGNSTNQNRTFIHTSNSCIVDIKIYMEAESGGICCPGAPRAQGPHDAILCILCMA
jgi:hypothetical protein